MNSHEAGRAPQYYEMRYELPAWSHFVWLIYLGFLFTPLLTPGHGWTWLWPTLLTIPIFVALYVSVILKFRRSDPPGAAALPEVLTIAAMGYLLAPVNDSANTYLVYCVAVAPFAVAGFRRLLLVVVLLMALYAFELVLLGFKPLLFGITIVVALASGASNYMMLENRRKNVALRRSAEEVQRLARVAERERIGRDLHDLLGHTLSLIAIKSELAAKLINRDRDAAAREITEVMNVARDSLRQVRTAVTGLKSAVLEGEMASARALLETVGVALTCHRDAMVLSAEIETSLAMIVREAVTNIQRHARAQRASVEVLALAEDEDREKGVLLLVTDDGRGGVNAEGNGLAGIRERVQSLGGTLDIDSPRGEGTRMRVRVHT
jgi:two-component system sensor histidine kinase DesK